MQRDNKSKKSYCKINFTNESHESHVILLGHQDVSQRPFHRHPLLLQWRDHQVCRADPAKSTVCRKKRTRFNLLLDALQNSFTIRKSMKFAPKPYKTVHHIFSMLLHYAQGRINHSGAPYTNVRRGPFSHTRSQDFLWACTFFSGCIFLPPKKLTTFFSRRRYV